LICFQQAPAGYVDQGPKDIQREMVCNRAVKGNDDLSGKLFIRGIEDIFQRQAGKGLEFEGSFSLPCLPSSKSQSGAKEGFGGTAVFFFEGLETRHTLEKRSCLGFPVPSP
jgi:hypothetical protein